MIWKSWSNPSLIGYLRSTRTQIRLLMPAVLAIVVVASGIRFLYAIFSYVPMGGLWAKDFFGIWSFAKFAAINPAVTIYDNSKLLDFQMDLGAAPRDLLPYPYPPFFLFLIFPFGFLSYYWGYALWSVLTFCFYFISSFYRRWRLSEILLVIFAPATLLNLNFGQTGFLSAALILGGFRFAGTRPALGGVLFGLASFKPQLGILIPIALISARLWRTLAAAVVTIAILVVASGLAFGLSIWPTWLEKLFPHAYAAGGVADRLKPTVTTNLVVLGVDLAVAQLVQISAAVVVAGVIWVFFRRGVTLLATAALLVGTFLATPYAFVYDMPMLTNAALMFIRHKDQTSRCLTVPEAAVLLLSLLLPAIMMETWRPSTITSIPLFLLLGLIVREFFRSREISRNNADRRGSFPHPGPVHKS